MSATLAFQLGNWTENESLTDDIRPEVRVGIALGEVVIADNTVTGPGVVLAQRIEQLAEAGGLCISAAIHEAVPRRLPVEFKSLGDQSVKGFDELVRVYSVSERKEKGAQNQATLFTPMTVKRNRRHQPRLCLIGLLLPCSPLITCPVIRIRSISPTV